jgi:hypothetical protein
MKTRSTEFQCYINFESELCAEYEFGKFCAESVQHFANIKNINIKPKNFYLIGKNDDCEVYDCLESIFIENVYIKQWLMLYSG